jgi:hypothetical protein
LSTERQHERYEELAAVAAIGELSAPEFEELREHLASCYGCRGVYGEFSRIASTDLGLLAVEKGGPVCNTGPEELDEAALLARIRAKAIVARSGVVEASETSHDRVTRTAWPNLKHLLSRMSYAVAALILVSGLCSLGYWLHKKQSQTVMARYEAELARLRTDSKTAVSSRHSIDEALAGSQTQLQELRSKLQQAEAEQSRLLGERDQLQEKLNSVEATAQEVQNELKIAESRREIEAGVRNQLQQELLGAKDRLDAQTGTVAELRAEVERRGLSRPATEAPAMSATEDARQLFGARDLHIVDVYDVDNNGKTKRTYGRVYYVERKLLVFYAFDLQGKKNKHDAVGFQAWGYRETGEKKPENLGLFRLDDPAANRWVLQVDNPHILERIDAVYVTAEPRDGSPSPRGRRLLYANLIAPANHP